jgi:hypothetical protein
LPKDGKAPSVAIYDNGDLRIVPIWIIKFSKNSWNSLIKTLN